MATGKRKFTDCRCRLTLEVRAEGKFNLLGAALNAVPCQPTSPRAPCFSCCTRSATGVVATWAPPESPNGVISGYQVLHWPFGLRAQAIVVDAGVNASSLTIVGLRPFTRYQVAVLATNGFGAGAESNPVEVLTNEAVPSGAPAVSAVNLVTATSVSVSLAGSERPTVFAGHLHMYTRHR